MKKGLLLLPLFAIGCMESATDPAEGSPASTSPAASTSAAQAEEIVFASGPAWTVSAPGSDSLGAAQNVCLNSYAPMNCPAGALKYGWPDGGWETDLSAIPGAHWIWAPGITGSTAPAYPAQYLFSREFDLPGAPLGGRISIAADDYAEVLVNGVLVGSIGSLTDVMAAKSAQVSLTTYDIGSRLVPGKNVIAVRGKNGPYGCGQGQYGCNPAGVVFGGSLRFRPEEPGLHVVIDVIPRSSANQVDLRGRGKIPVAILTTDDFEAATVDPASVRFGKTGVEAAALRSSLRDVNHDGEPDLLLYFETTGTGIACGDTAAALTGKTLAGKAIRGEDAIRTKCKKDKDGKKDCRW